MSVAPLDLRHPSRQQRSGPARNRRLRRVPVLLGVVLALALVAVIGVRVVRHEQGPWRSVVREDFSTPVAVGSFPGSSYRGTWTTYPDGWRDTSSVGVYAPTRVLDVANGSLNFHVHTEDGDPLGAAVVAEQTYGQTYGRYSVRWRSDPVTGYGLAFLLWPDSERWPADGEVDFPEGSLDGTTTATAHHADADGSKDSFDTGVGMNSWHTSTIEWLPGRITFLLDGRVVGRSTTKVPHLGMHWILQVGTDGTTKPAADATGDVQVDWVHIDAYRG